MKILRAAWRISYFLLYILTIIIFYPVYRLSVYFPRLRPTTQRLRRFGSNLTMFVLGIRTEIILEDGVDLSQPYVICPNHASYLDISAVLKAVPGYYHFMSKDDVAKMPFLGVFSRCIDIPTSREVPRQALKSLYVAEQHLKRREGIVVFPEGAFIGAPERLSEFKNGAFKLAIRNQVPVLPVTILNTWNLIPDVVGQGRPGKIRIVIHKPVETAGMSVLPEWITTDDVHKLRDTVRRTIETELLGYCAPPAYKNAWTGQALGPISVPELKTAKAD